MLARQSQAAPVATVAPSAPSSTTAAPSNASRQDALGLGGPAVTPAGTPDGALAALGDAATVVLDALPVGTALAMAWAHRTQPWAATWIAAQSADDLVSEGAAVLFAALDGVWPVGMGFGLGLGGGAEIGFGAEGEIEGEIERSEGAFSVEVRGELAALKNAGLGAVITGARGEAVLGAQAGGAAGVACPVRARWIVPSVLDLLPAGTATRFLVAAIRQPTEAARILRDAVRRQVESASPVELSVGVEGVGLGTVDAGLAVGTSAANVDGGADVTGGGAAGWDAHGAFVEVRLGVGAEGGIGCALLEGMRQAGGTAELLDAAAGRAVRVEGDLESMKQGFSGVRFVVRQEESGGADSLVADSLVELVSLLQGALLGSAEAGEALEVLPDVSLRRSVARPLEEAEGTRLPEWLGHFAEALPDTGFVVGFEEARVEAEVVVGPEAVAAATRGKTVRVSSEGPEATVLEIERAIAAEIVGGSHWEIDGALDVEAGVEEAELEHGARVATLVCAAGVGVSGEEALASENASLRGNARIFAKEELAKEETRGAFIGA